MGRGPNRSVAEARLVRVRVWSLMEQQGENCRKEDLEGCGGGGKAESVLTEIVVALRLDECARSNSTYFVPFGTLRSSQGSYLFQEARPYGTRPPNLRLIAWYGA